jgi:hypothetical protein
MAVMNGEVKVTIILRAPVQNSLRTDCLCIFDAGIGTCDRHVEAAVVLVLDNYDNNSLGIFMFWFFDAGSIAPVVPTRELKSALNYQIG